MSEEKMQNILEQYHTSIKKAKELVSNSDYILWLEKFTEKYPSFADDDWLYKEDELSKEDYEKVRDLQYFFSGIEDYANRNCNEINTLNIDFYNYYFLIKYNNVGYRLTLVCGQGSYISCKRVDDSNKDFINFNDIINSNNKNVLDHSIRDKFILIASLIDDLLLMDIPKDYIKQYIGNLLKD